MRILSIATMTNNMLEARRNGDLVTASYWADMLEYAQYIF